MTFRNAPLSLLSTKNKCHHIKKMHIITTWGGVRPNRSICSSAPRVVGPHKNTIFSTICLQPEGVRGWKVTGLLLVKSKACQTAASISSLRVAGGGWVCWGGVDTSVMWPLRTASVWEDSWTLWTTHSLMVQMLKRYIVSRRTRLRPPPLVCCGGCQVTVSASVIPFD